MFDVADAIANAPKPVRNHEAPVSTAATISGACSPATAVLLVTKEPIEKVDFMTVEPTGIAVAGDDFASRIVPIDDIDDATRQLLADPKVPKITYDSKLLTGALNLRGIEIKGISFDALLAAYLANSARTAYPLRGIIADFTGEDIAENDHESATSALRRVEPVLRARMQRDGLEKLHDDLELPLTFIIGEMEREGVNIDIEWLKSLGSHMESLLKELENEIFNLNQGERLPSFH